MVWSNRSQNSVNPAISLHWRGSRFLWVRFGRGGFRLFSERYQGTHGIPITWRYYLGGRVSVKWGNR